MPREDMSVQFVESGVGSTASKPAPMRGIARVECLVPRRKIVRQLRPDLVATLRIPTRPCAISTAHEPCTTSADVRQIPMNGSTSYLAMEFSGIIETGIPHGAPVITRSHRVYGRNNCWRTHQIFGLRQRNPPLSTYKVYKPNYYDRFRMQNKEKRNIKTLNAC